MREYLKERVSYAKCIVGGEEKDVSIQSVQIGEDGRIMINLIMDAASNDGQMITEIRFFGKDGTLLAAKEEKILCDSSLGDIYYRFYFTVEEAKA